MSSFEVSDERWERLLKMEHAVTEYARCVNMLKQAGDFEYAEKAKQGIEHWRKQIVELGS